MLADVARRSEMRRLIEDYKRCDRVLLLSDGESIASGAYGELLRSTSASGGCGAELMRVRGDQMKRVRATSSTRFWRAPRCHCTRIGLW